MGVFVLSGSQFIVMLRIQLVVLVDFEILLILENFSFVFKSGDFRFVLKSVFLEYFQELELIIFPGLIQGPESPQLTGTTRLLGRLQQARYVFGPQNILQLLVIIKVEVVKLLVVQFLFQNLLDELIDVLDLAINEALKHTKPFSVVKYFKGGNTP